MTDEVQGASASPVARALGPEAAVESEAAAPLLASTAEKPRLVRNTIFLVVSQFVSTPLSVIVNAVLARKLGADDFGVIYLTSTMATLGFLAVDWGQGATIAQFVARDRSTAAEVLGTSFVLKLAMMVLVTLALVGISWGLGYSWGVFIALLLTIAQQAFGALQWSFTSMMRGFERLDWVSVLTIASNMLTALFVIPVAMLGGGIRGTLASQAAAALAILVVTGLLIPRLHIPRPQVTRGMAKRLLHEGNGFILINVVLALQPYVDAVFLSQLASTQVVGWYAAARRLLGFLIFPATTVSFVLYPTMSRLWHENREEFLRLLQSTLKLVILIGVCASMGTFLFADFAISVVYSKSGYGPAIDNLRVLAAFVFLLYFTMSLGNAIAASGKQLKWAAAQTLCVVVSAIADPLLVPWCERRWKNGGLGVSIAAVISELLMVMAALIILRELRLLRSLARTVVPAVAGAAGMWVTAWALHWAPGPVGIVACSIVYVAIVSMLGGFDRAHLDQLKQIVRLKRQGINA